MNNNVEYTKRAIVEGLNKSAIHYMKKELVEEEELSDEQQLFISLLKGNDKEIEDKLYHYVYGNEYCWASDGGEPELGEVLAIKLLEKIKGEKYYASIIYQDDYLEHIFKKGKGDVKGK